MRAILIDWTSLIDCDLTGKIFCIRPDELVNVGRKQHQQQQLFHLLQTISWDFGRLAGNEGGDDSIVY